MNLADFLHANTYLRKLKVTLIVIGWGMVKYGCVLLGHGTLYLLYLLYLLYISRMNKWINWADFSMTIHDVGEAKSWFGYAHGQIWL